MSPPKKHLRTLRGIVEAPVEQVTPLALDVAPVEGVTVDADPAARTVAVQGGWWYRSETTVTPVPEGSLITQQIYNVARWMRWWVPIASRTPLRQAPAAFTRELDRIGTQLGVAHRLTHQNPR